jgi:DNA-binding CsgD family transcriptional regulator
MSSDFLGPVFNMVLGALALFAVQQLARLAHRSVPKSPDPGLRSERRLDFKVGVVDRFHEDLVSEEYQLWDNLTAREIEIARLVAQGKQNAEVARELQIRPYTVESHLKHTYAKLHVRSRTELAHALRELVN